MAKLLIRAVTNGTRPGHWKRGQVVAVVADNHQFGALEGPPGFYIVQLPGTVQEWRQKLQKRGEYIDSVTGEVGQTPRPVVGIDVDAPAPPPRAAARIPHLMKRMLRQPMSQILEHGEHYRIHRKGMPIRRY